jgi:hypothetical protein
MEDAISGAQQTTAQVLLEVGAMRSTLHVLASTIPSLQEQQSHKEERITHLGASSNPFPLACKVWTVPEHQEQRKSLCCQAICSSMK